MKNNDFWDKCEPGSIRHAVAQFIDHSPILSRYKGDKYYAIEDGIIDFIKQHANMIADEVEREYHREDILSELCMYKHLDYDEARKLYSIEVLDDIATKWDKLLGNSDSWFDAYWGALRSVFIEEGIIQDI